MHITLESGIYVVGVSGGVDSMVLLDLLTRLPSMRATSKTPEMNALNHFQLIVAHYDHGIREDSELDRLLVQKIAHQHQLPFVFDTGHLGPYASEALARKKRYEFLRQIQAAAGARAIITAHHQDDLLETALINLLRGTGRRGLSSLKSGGELVRPLLHLPKCKLIEYAKTYNIEWREDSTNRNTQLRRNWVRQHITQGLSQVQRQQFLKYITDIHRLNQEIDKDLTNLLHDLVNQEGGLDRQAFIALPHPLALEVMATWLRAKNLAFDRKSLERLVRAAKVHSPGKRTDIDAKYYLVIHKTGIMLSDR